MPWLRPIVVAAAASVSLLTNLPRPAEPEPPAATLLNHQFKEPSNQALQLQQRFLDILTVSREASGTPGLAACVSVRGRRLLDVGVGYSDVENLTQCTSRSVMRIASISKSFASLLAGRLMELGKLELDKPLGDIFNSDEKFKVFSAITPRQLLCHTSGVRHYRTAGRQEMKDPEYFINTTFPSVTDAVALFSNDPLKFEPGTQMLYTTHGYTLLSAVLERVADTKIETQFHELFSSLGITSGTTLERNAPITLGRSRQYQRDKLGKLVNSAYVDNSYKWAGGGIISCAQDVTSMGETLMRCYHGEDSLLQADTLRQLWTPQRHTKISWHSGVLKGSYGLGWGLCEHRGLQLVCHTGGAVGGTSILLMVPQLHIVICVLANLEAAPVALVALGLLDALLDSLGHGDCERF